MHNAPASTRTWTGTDVLLITAATLWGANYSLVKVVLRKVPPPAFNAVRLTLASIVFLAAIGVSRWLRKRRLSKAGGVGSGAAGDGRAGDDRAGDGDDGHGSGNGAAGALRETIVDLTPGGESSLAVFRTSTLSRGDWRQLVVLGLFGHFVYQVCFIEGLARTSVANASLLIGCTPMAVAIASAAMGSERLTLMHWIGTALSLGGIYLVVGHGDPAAGASLTGDLLMTIAVGCWVMYTLLGRELLQRHSPLMVTGYSMAIGTLFYLPYGAGALWRTPWAALEPVDWFGLAYATFLAFNVSYILWYAGLQRLGSARTSLYANLVPIVSLVVATAWLGERLGAIKIVGAAAVLLGLAITRIKLPRRE